MQINYRLENRRRDAKYGRPVPGAMVDTSELADKVRFSAPLVWSRADDLEGTGPGVPVYTVMFLQTIITMCGKPCTLPCRACPRPRKFDFAYGYI